MKTCFGFITVWCFSIASTSSGENHKPNIAIIGGGIAGTATAYFLSKTFLEECSIDLYEHKHIGGRIQTADIGGRTYEVGATMLHPSNLYMSRFSEILGLEKHIAESDGKIAISDGKEVLFKTSSSEIMNYWNVFWRYGLSPITASNLVNDMLEHFTRIYDCLDAGDAFTTVEQLLNAMGYTVYESTQLSTENKYKRHLVGETYINEIVQASLRVNYGQNISVQSLVGSISMAGTNEGLWNIKGGNEQVPRKLLEFSSATHIKEKVKTIQKLASNQFKVHTSEDARMYDIVIIAAPFIQQMTNINMEGIDLPQEIATKFHRTVATMVQGTARMVEEEGVEAMFFINSSSNINSVARNSPIDDKEETSDLVYKVFSQSTLTFEEMLSIFTNWSSASTFDWLAYPHYSSSASLGSFILHERLFYVNAIEAAASAMEMLAIAAKNVASLAYYDWTKADIPQHCHRRVHADEL